MITSRPVKRTALIVGAGIGGLSTGIALAPRFDATFRAVTSATEDLRYDELADRDPHPTLGKTGS